MLKSYGKILSAVFLFGTMAVWADAHADWKAYFGLNPDQQKKFDQANKDKTAKVKPLRDREQPAIENLRNLVDAKAGDDQVRSAFSDVRLTGKSIQDAEEQFLDALTAFLTPTQEAKLLLKNHAPKNGPGAQPLAGQPLAGQPPAVQPPKPPEDSAQKALEKQAAEAWKQSFALTPDQKKQFDAANKAKGQTMKQLQADKETALEQLSQKVEAKAADSDIKGSLDNARHALAAIPAAENSYWEGLAGFLNPTQQAKLYLKGKPKKK